MEDSGLRNQISNLHSLFVLSLMMAEAREADEIFRLAVTSVAPLGTCLPEGAYLAGADGRLTRSVASPPDRSGGAVGAALDALDGTDGPVDVPGLGWGCAFALRSLAGLSGYLVIGAPAEPTADEQFLLRVLAQQTGASLANAALHRQERALSAELRSANEALAAVNEQLTATVADLERSMEVHEVLTAVAACGSGEEGIAAAVHRLTGLPVAVEDRFGNLRAWAGPGCPDPYPKPDSRARAQVLRRAARDGRPVRVGGRLVAPAQPQHDVLGVLSLLDPDESAGRHDVMALQHGALVLSAELAHRAGLAEVELRLRRDLVDDLLAGTDDESAYARAEAIGYDLHRPHHVVVVVEGPAGAAGPDALARSVEHAAANLDLGSMLGRRSGAVVLLAPTPPSPARWDELHEAVAGGTTGIGVGGACSAPSEFPRSAREAFLALGLRQGAAGAAGVGAGVTVFDSLGVYRLLAGAGNQPEVERFVTDWLGPLIGYDRSHRSDLVKTLSAYLDCGGSYDETAEALTIHRSTLRYRLQRIRDVSGFDLNDVEARFNLHVATRAWRVLGAATPTGPAGAADLAPPG